MTTLPSWVRTTGASPGRIRCWLETLVLGLGVPAAIWVISKLTSLSIPATDHGTPAQRFLLWVSHGVVAEWAFVAAVWLLLRRRGFSFEDLGVRRMGTWSAWVVALLLAGLSIGSNLRFLHFVHIPISHAFFPSGFHLVAALMMGITAGFCEEVLFRGFLMTEFASAGYGKILQVLIPGLAFGLAHAGFLTQGFMGWLGIMLPTAFLGMMWGVAYLLGHRSLVPVVVAHFLNDGTVLPWIMFFMVTAKSP